MALALLAPQPLQSCIEHTKQTQQKPYIIQMDPAGTTFDAVMAERLSKYPILNNLSREGIDARITETYVDELVSMGPYVVSGGDLPAMSLLDAVIRHLPGTLGNQDSAQQTIARAAYTPHYTRPAEHALGQVPEVLTSGNHADIMQWRRMMALGRTWSLQPQLLQNQNLSQTDIELLSAYIQMQQQKSRD